MTTEQALAQEASQAGTQTNVSVEAEAAAWAARLDAMGNTPDPQSQEELAQWLAGAGPHRGALLRAQALLHLATYAAPAVADEAEPVILPAIPPQPASELSKRRWLWAGLGLAAAVAAVAVLIIDPDARSYTTEPGELRQISLADGSALTLDATSKLAVDLDPDQRAVTLKQGRALFRVSHDAARPFSVTVGDVTITDVGTVFSVSARKGVVEVVVSEGLIDVVAPGTRLRLGAGQRIRLPQGQMTAPPMVERIAPAAVDRAMAWTSGKLDLDGETLASAIEAMNNRNRVQIRLANAAIGRERLYGAFRLDDPLGFARTAALSVNAPVREASEEVVIGEK